MGMNWALRPTTNLPSRVAKKVSNWISPSDEVGNRFKGFLSGAVEGAGDYASDMTSPLGIAGLSTGGLGSLASRFARGASGLSRSIGPTMDLIESPAIRQVAPSMDDVNSLIGDMSRNLARIPSAGQRAMTPGISPSSLPADLVARGSESIYNVGRSVSPLSRSLEDLAYETIRNPNKIRSSIGGDFNVAEMMRKLNEFRGR